MTQAFSVPTIETENLSWTYFRGKDRLFQCRPERNCVVDTGTLGPIFVAFRFHFQASRLSKRSGLSYTAVVIVLVVVLFAIDLETSQPQHNLPYFDHLATQHLWIAKVIFLYWWMLSGIDADKRPCYLRRATQDVGTDPRAIFPSTGDDHTQGRVPAWRRTTVALW